MSDSRAVLDAHMNKLASTRARNAEWLKIRIGYTLYWHGQEWMLVGVEEHYAVFENEDECIERVPLMASRAQIENRMRRD
mgnify:FL=1